MKNGARRAIRFALILALCPPPALAGQEGREALAALERRVEAAREDGWDRLAPRGFERARDALANATERLLRDGPDARFRERLAEARARLEEAERVAERGERILAEAIAARRAALEPEAPRLAPEIWADAEDRFADAAERLERNDVEEAAERGDLAATRYRQAARAAWDRLRFGDAEAARERAIAAGARELAPETFGRGDRALARGRAELEAGRTGAATLEAADAAERAYARAAGIAALADSVARRAVPVERLVLARASDLVELSERAAIEVDAEDPPEAVDRLGGEIGRLRSEVAGRERELEAERARASSLEDRIAALEGELEELRQRFLDTRQNLIARQERDARILELQALFSPEEGEVLVSGNEILLRLFGLTFESGSDEILPEHEALLTKVQRAVQAFENARLRIEGHTDGRGSADANRSLSQRRAIAVRDYLLSRLPISAARVAATGFGEDRPIATDDTEEGRARNRRIEIVMTLPAAGR